MRFESSFEFDGDLIIVEAVVVGPNGQVDVRLVLDMGVVSTTLVPRIAESIGYSSAARVARSVIRSAVAEGHGYIVHLVKLSTLGFTVPFVHADVADLGHEHPRTRRLGRGRNMMKSFEFLSQDVP